MKNCKPINLKLIKNLQQGAKIEIEETTDSDTILDDSSLEPSHTDDVDENKITQRNGLRTLESLESVASITKRR